MRPRIPNAWRIATRRGINSTPQSRVAQSVLTELERRGFIATLTHPHDTISSHLSRPTPRTIYSGVDPSASSLHVGNLLPLLGLLHLTANGHQSLALIGGATGSIGDPSGRSTERNALSQEELEGNVAAITGQVHRFFARGMDYADKRGYGLAGEAGRGGVKVVNNLDWTKGLGMLDFLKTVGKVARVNIMLSRDSVKNRLSSDSGISFTEFSYQLLQAYDFHHLHQEHGCTMQLGGSDQWGNIVAGIDLIKSLNKGEASPSPKGPPGPDAGSEAGVEAYGLTIPLLTTGSGEKFGKSAGNAVWLDETRTGISDFYQFFLRSTDEDVGKYLRLFTLLPLERIDEIMAEHAKSSRAREAQRILAEEITELVHGPEGVKKAQTIASLLFRSDIRSLRSAEILPLTQGSGDPSIKRVNWRNLRNIPISKLAVTFGICKSRSEANKLISSRSVWINDTSANDPRREISRSDIFDGHLLILRVGKSRLIIYVDFD